MTNKEDQKNGEKQVRIIKNDKEKSKTYRDRHDDKKERTSIKK